MKSGIVRTDLNGTPKIFQRLFQVIFFQVNLAQQNKGIRGIRIEFDRAAKRGRRGLHLPQVLGVNHEREPLRQRQLLEREVAVRDRTDHVPARQQLVHHRLHVGVDTDHVGARGQPGRSLTASDLATKFQMCARRVFSPSASDRVLEALRHLEELDDVAALTELLVADAADVLPERRS